MFIITMSLVFAIFCTSIVFTIVAYSLQNTQCLAISGTLMVLIALLIVFNKKELEVPYIIPYKIIEENNKKTVYFNSSNNILYKTIVDSISYKIGDTLYFK